jgi:hypothetical protein
MEITINEENKTIKLHGNVKLKDLFDFIEKFSINIDGYSVVGTETLEAYSPSPPDPWQYPIYPFIVLPSTGTLPYTPPWTITYIDDKSSTTTQAKVPSTPTIS